MTASPITERSMRATWERWLNIWSARDDVQRSLLLPGCVAPDAVYTDPLVLAEGYEEIAVMISGFQKQVPGGSFVTKSFIQHHDQALATWMMIDANGIDLNPGSSYVRAADADHFLRMSGFFAVASPQPNDH
jgi:hypothetical protein